MIKTKITWVLYRHIDSRKSIFEYVNKIYLPKKIKNLLVTLKLKAL